MAHALLTIRRFYSKLDEFRTTETYTDVYIKCGHVQFPCHRVVLAATSEYFHSLLGGYFEERANRTIELQEVDPVAFEEVLRFAYTGESVITPDNVYSLLSASDLFLMNDLQDKCVGFVMRNHTSLQNVFELFRFARATAKNTLINDLSGFVARHLESFYKTSAFLDLPYEDLRIILDRWSTSSTLCDARILAAAALVHWTHHSRPERLRYLNEYVEAGVLPATTRPMIEKYVAESNLTPSCELSDLHDVEVHGRNRSLHVFVMDDKMSLVTYSIDSLGYCSVSNEVLPLWFSPQVMKTAVLNESAFYCYSYHDDCDQSIDHIVRSSFRVFTSIDMRAGVDLKNLPLFNHDVEICSLQNNIYLYRRSEDGEGIHRNTSMWRNLTTMNNEEIQRLIYVYNTEVDNWFSMPRMKVLVNYACMTSCNGNLYLLGGEDENHFSPLPWNVQAFDPRTGEWRLLPHSQKLYHLSTDDYLLSCCTLNEKIYVLEAADNQRPHVYDPVAGKWERIEPMNSYPRSIISYDNQLWALGNQLSDLEVYEPHSDKWQKVFDPATEVSNTCDKVMGSVVFKTL